MSILSTLYSKLALATLVLFVLLGTVSVYISTKTSEIYALETTQRINRDIARHAAEDMLLLSNGVVNEAALKELAHHVMFINPIVEVYLLDARGRILSHASPYHSVLMDKIDIAPIHQFIDARAALPIFGDDPKNPGKKQVFSVSPIKERGKTVAYLYTILNGQRYQSIRQSLHDSYNLQVGTTTIVISVLLAAIAGLLVFAFLTRRLRRLIDVVRIYRKSTAAASADDFLEKKPRDEIDELSQAISSMSTRIDKQFIALQEVDNTRRELIANVSHDLRTPLASLQGYLETILIKADSLSDGEKKNYLETAYNQSKRLNQLINELFELAKLESAGIEPDWESFALMELVQDLVQDYELQASERGIILEVRCDKMDLTVYADISLIHRVLENLLKNAIEHSRSGGEIIITLRSDEKKAWLEIADTGKGIASHEIPYIFDRFYRPSTEQPDTGNGLGLAIVKRILELHRSSVAVQSEIDKGTTFSFWLPQSLSY